MKKLWITAGIVAVVVLAVVLTVIQTKKEPDEIKIGAILPLTGDATLYGESPKKGIDLAVEQINNKGGIKGGKCIVIFEDSKAVPASGVAAFQKLVNVQKVSAIIGDAASSVTLAFAPLAEKNKVVVLSPLSSAPAITNAGDFIFRIVPSDLFGGKVAGYFAVEDQGWRKLAVLFVNNDFGVGLKQVFSKEVESLGGTIVASEAYEQGATDFRTQLLKIKSAIPEAIFLIGYRESPQILIQAKEIGLKTKFLGTGVLEDPNVIKVAKDAAEGIYFTQLQYDVTSNEPIVENFVSEFIERYNSKPDIFAAYGYDAMSVLALAIERSNLTPESIRDQLYKIRNFKGVTGDISFDESGDVIQPMGIKTVKSGEFVWFKKEIFIK
ncbi:MAG TPA: ABC transporter substrate-binding protein [Candidatus Brocadiia bacterium]|nr:ABC transporter substrate-binding protein [Candidatus Brocadiales bacterium]